MFKILHLIPGRARLRFDELKGHPELARRLHSHLEAVTHINRVTEALTPFCGVCVFALPDAIVEDCSCHSLRVGAATLFGCAGSEAPQKVSRLFDIVDERKRNAGGSVLAVHDLSWTLRDASRMRFEKPSVYRFHFEGLRF